MAAILVVVLYLAPIIWFSIRLGMRNGRRIDARREDLIATALVAAAYSGVYTVLFFTTLLTMNHLYSEFPGNERPAMDSRQLLQGLKEGLSVGMWIAIGIAIPVGLVAVVFQLITAWRMGDRVKCGHCSGCGYDLTGNASGRCPECGRVVG